VGYIAHHTVIVTGHAGFGRLAEVHELAKEIFVNTSCVVTSILGPVSNGTCFFYITPDGSKEGWADSAEGDASRSVFFTQASQIEDHYCHILSLRFGGDDSHRTEVEYNNELEEDEPDELEEDGEEAGITMDWVLAETSTTSVPLIDLVINNYPSSSNKMNIIQDQWS
jgi:hypothetical protein